MKNGNSFLNLPAPPNLRLDNSFLNPRIGFPNLNRIGDLKTENRLGNKRRKKKDEMPQMPK